MLKIRLQRAGRRNLPIYRVVVAEASAPVKGKFIKKLGFYNPIAKKITLDAEAILSWLNKGAKPSNTLARLMLKQGIKHKEIIYIKRKARNPKDIKQTPIETAKKLDAIKTAPVDEQKIENEKIIDKGS